jgi:hypothetical protein
MRRRSASSRRLIVVIPAARHGDRRASDDGDDEQHGQAKMISSGWPPLSLRSISFSRRRARKPPLVGSFMDTVPSFSRPAARCAGANRHP